MHSFLTTSFFTTSLSLLKSTKTGTGINLLVFDISISAFKLVKSDFVASLDVSIRLAFLNSVFNA